MLDNPYFLLSFLSTVLAVTVAGAGLYAQALLERVGALGRAGAKAMSGLYVLHSGHVGDYVARLVVGMAMLLLLVGARWLWLAEAEVNDGITVPAHLADPA